jgi:hypothetical protein
MLFAGTLVAVVLTTAAVLPAVSATTASGEAGHLPLLFNFGIAPSRLPAEKPAPVTMSLSWKGRTDDGSHLPALWKLTIEGDRHIAADVTDLPVCEDGPHFDIRPSGIPKRCRKAAVGHGHLTVEVEYPNQPPVSIDGELTFYNLGRKPGGFDLLAHTFLVAPVTAELLFKIEVRKAHRGRIGWTASAALPKIAGGYGSITAYSLRVDKRLLAATCVGGKLTLRAFSRFADGTKRRETVVRACSVAEPLTRS